jgi:hypothetical protein
MSKVYREPDMRRYSTGNRQYSEVSNCGKASWQTCESFLYYKAKKPSVNLNELPTDINFMVNGKSYRLHIDNDFINLYQIFEDEDDLLISSIDC